jgi:hypothetical protein
MILLYAPAVPLSTVTQSIQAAFPEREGVRRSVAEGFSLRSISFQFVHKSSNVCLLTLTFSDLILIPAIRKKTRCAGNTKKSSARGEDKL